MERLLITPAREFILPEAADNDAGTTEEISEFAIPVIHSQPASLLDYLPKRSLVLLDDLQAIQDAITEIEEQAVGMRRDLVSEGSLAEDFPIPYLTWTEIADTLPRVNTLELSASVEAVEDAPSTLAQCFSAGPRFAGQLKPFIDHLVNRVDAGERVTIVSRRRHAWKSSGKSALCHHPPAYLPNRNSSKAA